MFSSLKFNSLKCQSNGSSDKNKDNCEEEDDDDDGVSDHMYEKLQSFDNKQCKCHLDNIRKPSKPSKNLFNKRISKWRMECSNMKNLQNGSPQDDRNSKNNQEKRITETFTVEQAESTRSKITTVNIERENGNLGITLRGGYHQNSDLSRPLIITYIKPDGPVAREGTIKPGDRLLAVDGVSIAGSSLNDAQTLLKQPSPTTLLTIEYDVNIIQGVDQASGPLLVEIERKLSQQLGLTLFQNEGGIIIEKVKSGSLADRCGALHVGDEILAINSTRIGGTSIALEDVLKILDCECPSIRLEILPSYAASCYSNYGTWRTRGSSLSGISLFKDPEIRKSKNSQRSEAQNVIDQDLEFLNSRCLNHSGNELGLVHSETLHTLLVRENGSFGLEFVDAPDGSVIINSVFPEGPAERSQCLHPGDRVLSLNHKSLNLSNLKAKDAQNLLEYNAKELMNSKLSIVTEFDVLDTVIPSSGIFLVKLVNRGSAGLGITITASKTSGFIIYEMKKGSIAYRAGSLIPGDRLLAINNVPLDHCSMEYAAHILHESKNVVTLKVQREASSSEFLGCRRITYSVDLQRFGGPLGITIAGSEEPFQPITISGLTNGGLAEQSGVIHIGDEILAINNHSIYGEPLSKAHYLLQNSSDLVTLKLSRPLLPICRVPTCQSPVFPSSIDSAVESWDSSHLDLVTSPDYQKPLKETKDALKKNAAKEQSQSLENNLSFIPKNIHKICATNNTQGNDSNLAILDEITSENLKIKRELDMLTQKLDEKRTSKLQENEMQDFNSIACSVNDLQDNKNSPKSIEMINSDQDKKEEDSNSFKKEAEEIPMQRFAFGNVMTNNFDLNLEAVDSVQSNDFKPTEKVNFHKTRTWPKNQYLGNESNPEYIRHEFQSSQLYEVTLYKDPIYEDFGFSVSDGLYERGVFINRIRKGGPADLSKILKPYDRILQVNDTYTQDFDCCLTVPLIASAGDCLVLLVARNLESTENDIFDHEKFSSHGVLMHNSNLSSQIQDDLKRILV